MKQVFLLLIIFISLFAKPYNLDYNKSQNSFNEKIENFTKEIQSKIDKIEWQNNNSIDNLNNRIEAFGNYLDISNNRNEIIIAFFGILMTILVIYFGLKNTKEAKLVAKEEAENALDKWIDREAKDLIAKTQKKISKKITAEYIKKAKKENDRQILNLLETYESKILLQEDDIELSLHSKEALKEEARRVKLKSLPDRNFNDWLKLIFYSIAIKEYNKSYDYLNQILKNNIALSNIQLSRLFYLKGFVADKNNDEKNTIKFYEKAIELSPNFTEAYRRLGLFYSNIKKDYKKAIKLFNKIIKINKNDYRVYTNLGTAYRRLNNHKKAKKNYLKAIKLNPDDRRAYNNLGYLFLIEKQYDEAIKFFYKAINVDPESAIVSYNNIFRIQLILNNHLDKQLEKEYVEKFQDKGLDSFANYELYKILYIALHNDSILELLNEWKEKYGHTKHRQFFFDELIEWANNKNDIIKNRLIKAINFFKQYYV